MIHKALLSARACVGILACMAIAVLPNQLPAQSIASDDPLLYMARGTGRTTGDVIQLLISNPTTAPMRTSVGDCYIPPAEGYQGYVITDIYPVTVPPLSTVTVQLKGYCTNFDRPALADGAAAVEVSEWITWSAADPMPERGKPIPTAFVPAAAVQDDPLVLTYPGSAIPFSYRLDMDKNPQAAARLLLHTAYAAEKAFDQLQTEGKVRVPAGRATDAFRQELVQQVLWAYASRLGGNAYSKPHFAAQLTEEAEQQMNQPAKDFSPETQQEIERQTQDVWASISLVGASAKLIPVAERPTDVFKTTPAGGEMASPNAVKDIVNNIDPTRQGAGDQLIPVLSYLQKNAGAQDMQTLMATAITKWKAFLNQSLTATAISPSAFLTAAHYLMINPGNTLNPSEQESYLHTLQTKLSTYLQQQAANIQTSSPDYLQRRRNLSSWQKTPWYQKHCMPADPLKKMTAMPERTAPTIAFNPSNIQLSGESWKHAFPPPVKAGKKKTPLWVPIVGVAGAGTISYFLLQKKDGDKTPAAPVANPDAVTIPCGGQVDLNLLANDTGEGIYISSAGSSAGLTITILDAQRVHIVATGTGVFSAIYTITDRVSQSANSTITITVIDQTAPVITCPPAITLEGCGEIPPPTVSGQATATDDCDPSPVIGFADEPGGTPCDRIITRSWTSVDASGKNAVCTQIIAVKDISPPTFTLCPSAITVSFGSQNDLNLTGKASTTDNCNPGGEPSFTDDLSGMGGCTGAISRSWTAVDSCGNAATCTQLITVVDNQPPAVACPPTATVECGKQSDISITGQATATDNCTAPLTPAYTDNPPTFSGCSGNILRTWTAVDSAGNTGSCLQTIVVQDLSAPVFTNCPMAVTVLCGQQNDLDITGQATAADACNGPASITFTDDLSQFTGCEGIIIRSFIATDLCGNTALCQQVIWVEAVPCNLIATFATEPAICGNCNGEAAIAISPPGSYTYVWENGITGPIAQGLCPGPVTVTVTDQVNNCTEIFTVSIPEEPMLTLTVLQIIPPSGPSSNDGRVVLEITPAGAQPPFLIFVNGTPSGLSNSPIFQIINLPPGEYEIMAVDQGGEGCPSNIVLVIMIPQAMLPPLEISTPGSNPGIYHDPEAISQTLSTQIPEHPATEPLHTRYTWAPAWGIAAGISIAEYWQLRLEAARQTGLLFSPTPSGLTYQTPVQAGYTRIGARKYFPQHTKWTFFQEINASRITLRSGNTLSNADQQRIATAQQDAFWQSSLGGGLRRQLAPNIMLEMNLQLAFQLRKNARDTSWSPSINIRLHSVIRNPQSVPSTRDNPFIHK